MNAQLNTEDTARLSKAMVQAFEGVTQAVRKFGKAWKKVSESYLKISEDVKKENCVITAEILSKRRKRNGPRKKKRW